MEFLIRNGKTGNSYELIKGWGSLESSINELLKMYDQRIPEQEASELKSLFELDMQLDNLSKSSSYLDAFLPLFASSAYSLPENYFNKQNTPRVMIESPNSSTKYTFEDSDYALHMCFPGSVTFRYGSPIKIKCGTLKQSQSDTRTHALSEKPIEGFTVNSRPVFSIDRLKTIPSRRNNYICRTCLAVQDRDESCSHSGAKQFVRKYPFRQPLKTYRELERRVTRDPKRFPHLLDQAFDEILFLDYLKVGVALTGFSSTWEGATVDISYSPYVGFVLETKGISFKLARLSNHVVQDLLKVNHIARDLVLGQMALSIYDSCRPFGILTFHSDLFVSSALQSLKMDQIDQSFDLNTLIDLINTDEWIDKATLILNRESQMFGIREPYSDEKIANVFHALQNTITSDSVEQFARKVHANSMAQAIFLASVTTSGSLLNDLSYRLSANDQSYEVVLFDNTAGGNGSSELIYEYLSLAGYTAHDVEHRPHFMDETLMEYILPCKQGTIDRIFYQNMSDMAYDKMLKPGLANLDKLKKESPAEYDLSVKFGIENVFPRGIGIRHIGNGESPEPNEVRTAEKIREISNICIHGCPDCISLSSRSVTTPYKERYVINKYLLDLTFTKSLSKVTLSESASIEEIVGILRDTGIVKLTTKQRGRSNRLENLVNSLLGIKIGGKTVKMYGNWPNCTILSEPYVESSYLFAVV